MVGYAMEVAGPHDEVDFGGGGGGGAQGPGGVDASRDHGLEFEVAVRERECPAVGSVGDLDVAGGDQAVGMPSRSSRIACMAGTRNTVWPAMRLGPTSFGVVDAFPDDAGRHAHLAANADARHRSQTAEQMSLVRRRGPWRSINSATTSGSNARSVRPAPACIAPGFQESTKALAPP
jgi:hypothetical protein